jgi:hypothetical protein
MSEDVRPEVKTNQTLLDKIIPQPLERLITAAFTKLKNVWTGENTLTGIQFYGDMDD